MLFEISEQEAKCLIDIWEPEEGEYITDYVTKNGSIFTIEKIEKKNNEVLLNVGAGYPRIHDIKLAPVQVAPLLTIGRMIEILGEDLIRIEQDKGFYKIIVSRGRQAFERDREFINYLCDALWEAVIYILRKQNCK